MSILLWSVGIVAIFVAAIFKYFQFKAQYWSKRGFPSIGSDITGNFLVNILTKLRIHDLDQRIYNGAKPLKQPIVGSIEFGVNPTAHIMDLDLMKHIFIKDFDYFADRREMKMDKTDPMIGRMVFFMEGEAWKELRSKMSPTFTTGKIRRMFEIFQLTSTKLVDFVEKERGKNNGVVSFDNAFEQFTMEVIASAAFGVDAKTFSEETSIFQLMGNKMKLDLTFKVLCIFILMVTAPRLASALGIGVFDKAGSAFFTQVILSAIKQREVSGVKRDDFLQLMLEARNGQLKTETEELSTFEKEAQLENKVTNKQDKVLLTDDVIVAQSVLFILAGYDTTQAVLLFILYHLAVYPDVQEKLAKAVRKARVEAGGKFTYESINELAYLDQVINESLRLYPPVPRLDRKTMADYKVPGTDLVIPKGVLVSMPTYCIHRDPDYYPDPEKFDPDRFSAEEKSKRHPMTFQPFGHGPRNCIGMRFALTNTKMAIASLVDNFTFEPSASTIIPARLSKSSSLKPEGGVSLKVHRRGHD